MRGESKAAGGDIVARRLTLFARLMLWSLVALLYVWRRCVNINRVPRESKLNIFMWKKVRQFLAGGGCFQMSNTSETQTNFAAVADAAALDELVTRSHDAPVVLFKHSTTCPISARAHNQMLKLGSDMPGRISLVVVQNAREVSRRVAEQTGIQHESPQAIILRNGQAVWSASHFDITAEAVAQAMRENE